MHNSRSYLHFAKLIFAALASSYLLGFSVISSAEIPSSALSITTELSTVPETIQPEALPDAIEIEGDKLDLYLDRKMRASGNAVISKGEQKVYGDNIEYDVQNDELKVDGNVRIDLATANCVDLLLKCG